MKKISLIAEIGINHEGKFDTALELIKAASEAGVSGVKFQYRNLENAYSVKSREIGDEILFKEITRNYLSPVEIISLVDLAHALKIEAGISFFEESDISDFGESISKFDFFKAPSVELTNINLINQMLKFCKPVYVSLGCQTEESIEIAFKSFDGDNWLPMHCISNYPTSLANAKLGYLNHMKSKWKRPFGYSSHDENWEVCIIAMSMGASVIERHITFDKLADGLDHSTSSTPDEFKKIKMFADGMQLLLSGNSPRALNQGEKLNLQNLGRSYYAKKTIELNEPITLDKLSFRSPRVGLGASEIDEYIGRSPIKRIKAGDVLSRSYFHLEPNISDSAIEFARQKKVALPVRLHDIDLIENKFPLQSFEFHLSYGEVLSGLDGGKFNAKNNYSIHLPDYISSTKLMDPFSLDKGQREQSFLILEKTVEFAHSLQDLTGKIVPIVGSFSIVNNGVQNFYQEYSALLEGYRNHKVHILPQWLPPIAWYFGGSVKLDVMNQLRDVELLDEFQIPICMDICHLNMGDSLFKYGSTSVINHLLPLIHHVHLADSRGVDGEGVDFGDGDPQNLDVIGLAINIDCMKVVEVWQGHLDDGAGFKRALTSIDNLFNSNRK